MKNKIICLEELTEHVKAEKAKGKRIVSTSGCFDILHAGHVTYLEEARQKGDVLIVLLNSDSSVYKLKGAARPIVPEDERAIVLAGLACVDYVCIFSEQTPCGIIEQIQPDIVVKGGDYQGTWIPEMDSVAAYGGSVVYASIVDGCSTTNIIKKIEELQERSVKNCE